MTKTIDISTAAAALGRKGGQSTSEAKRAAARANGKRGGRPQRRSMNYTVEVNAKDGEPISATPGFTEAQAKRTAKREAKDNPNVLVFVSWFRPSDGQHGYLNPDGNHALTGRAW